MKSILLALLLTARALAADTYEHNDGDLAYFRLTITAGQVAYTWDSDLDGDLTDEQVQTGQLEAVKLEGNTATGYFTWVYDTDRRTYKLYMTPHGTIVIRFERVEE
jgi:hypothetical protein